jgi:hypothetical protein
MPLSEGVMPAADSPSLEKGPGAKVDHPGRGHLGRLLLQEMSSKRSSYQVLLLTHHQYNLLIGHS